MSMGVGIKLSGVAELEKALKMIPNELRRDTYKHAITKGARIAVKAAKKNARAIQDTGALAKSIGHKVNKSGTWAGIGARRGQKQPAPPHRRSAKYPNINPFNYAHLVELGTSHSPAMPFLRPAIDNNTGQILAAIADGIEPGLDKAVAKFAKKQARRR